MSNILTDYQRVLDKRRADRSYLAQVARGKRLALLADWKQQQPITPGGDLVTRAARVLTKEQFYAD